MSLSYKYIFFVLLLVTFNGFLSAQENDSIYYDLKFRHYTINDGLSHTSITDINQDHNGFIWIATKYGLNRFDGIEFKSYFSDEKNSNSISSDNINILFVDSNNNLWIGTSKGLSLYKENDRFKNIYFNHSSSINSICEDSNKNLWIGTDNGLIYFDTSTGTNKSIDLNYNKIDGLSTKRIDKVFIDSKENLWILTLKGLVCLPVGSNQFKQYPFDSDVIDDPKNSGKGDIKEDANGNIWIGSFTGLWKFNEVTKGIEQFKLKNNNNSYTSFKEVRTILTDESNTIWIGTYSGVYKINTKDKSFSNYTHNDKNPYSLSQNSVYKIFKDDSNGIWIGTWQGAVNYLDKNFDSFQHYGIFSGLSYHVVSSFAEDEKHNFWIGTERGGLNYFDTNSKTFKIYKNNPDNPNGLGNDNIQDIVLDKQGILFIATHGSGLDVYDTKANTNKFHHFKSDIQDDESISSDWVTCLMIDTQNRLWVGTIKKGLNLFDPKTKKFTRFNTDIFSQTIYEIFEDKQQRVWAGTANGMGLVDLKTKTINSESISILNNRISSLVTCIYQDDENNFWVATEGQGLFFLKNDFSLTKQFTVLDGLSSNSILGILPDKEDNLWLSTFKGLSRFDFNLNEFTNYDALDGLQSNEFNYDAYYAAQNGELLFGGMNGFNIFNPKKIKKNPYVPPVVITDFKIKGHSIDISKDNKSNISEVVINHNDIPFSLDFAALNYTQPRKNIFKYKLEGKDDQWHLLGNERSLTFADANPGNYIFKLKAANNSGVWNENEASIIISILPPWWKTNIAYAIYFLLICITVWLIYMFLKFRRDEKELLKTEKIEKEKIQEISQLKLQFFTNVSHELRTPLTLILGSVEEMSKDVSKIPENLKNHLEVLNRNSKNLLRHVNSLLDFRKNEVEKLKLNAGKGNIIHFLKESSLSFQELATHRKIEYQFKNDRESIELYYDRDKMEIIIFNLLSNAFKFTPDGGKITIKTRLVEDEYGNPVFFEFAVKDNGIGIPKEKAPLIFNKFYQVEPDIKQNEIHGSGIGLALVKDLVDLHHGSISLNLDNKKGAEFIISIPMGKDHLKEDEILKNLKKGDDINSYLKQEELKEESKSDIKHSEKDETILIVEDNLEIRNFILKIFANDYNLFEASDGAEGYDIAIHQVPDLIISDIMMPEIDGITLCGKLKTDLRTSHIPIILLTARTSVIFKDSGFETGADAYITKPFKVSHLKLRVKNLLSSRKMQQEYFIRNYKVVPEAISLTSRDDEFLRTAIEVVQSNMDNSEFNSSQFGEIMGMSRSALYKKLKGLTGQSPTEFVRMIRVKRAAQLFLQNKFNISEVIYSVGFNDLKYFRTCFREQFKMSPSEFIESQNKSGIIEN
ncbi:two-component regulator propeller domain-containing protein [Gaetbulibacter aquiaggeris]|uniref:histidine kinase n=1 Tax=Gaetbulibacter aquiaggeris TaxID=1735373 RepID=A0ABW7MMB3_9FLAO